MKPLDFLGSPILLSTEFGSESADHRIKLRKALQTYVRDESHHLGRPIDRESADVLIDLSKPPRIPAWAISVSHCPVAGGFIAVPSEYALGFDLEIANRLTLPVLERVAATPREKELLRKLPIGDERAYFWVAKEAAIKAFGNAQPNARPHFGDVELTALDASAKTFRAENVGRVVRGRLYRILEIEATPIVAGIAQFDK